MPSPGTSLGGAHLPFPDPLALVVAVVQSLTRVRLFATPWTAARLASLSIINCWSLLKLMSTESVMPSNHLILSSLSPSAFNLSQHQRSFPLSQFFPSGGQSIGSFSINLSNKYTGLIFFRMDWLDLLAVQGTLKSLLQHHNSKALILRQSAFFTVQLSHPSIHDYWKNHSFD